MLAFNLSALQPTSYYHLVYNSQNNQQHGMLTVSTKCSFIVYKLAWVRLKDMIEENVGHTSAGLLYRGPPPLECRREAVDVMK